MCVELLEMSHALVIRESLVEPGLLIGTPVKMVKVDPPKTSFRNANLPYVKVLVQLPNGETRNINGEVLEKSDSTTFEIMEKAFSDILKYRSTNKA